MQCTAPSNQAHKHTAHICTSVHTSSIRDLGGSGRAFRDGIREDPGWTLLCRSCQDQTVCSVGVLIRELSGSLSSFLPPSFLLLRDPGIAPRILEPEFLLGETTYPTVPVHVQCTFESNFPPGRVLQ